MIMINATDELRRLLDERGVEYTTRNGMKATSITHITHWYADGVDAEFTEQIKGCTRLTASGLTPEQAIAATLRNDDDYERKMDALICRLTNGKWSKSRAYDLDFMEQCINEEFEMLYAKELADAELGNGTLTAEQVRAAIFSGSTYASYDGVKYYADGIRMQAIADELNATLGNRRAERTCENVNAGDSKANFICSECGLHIHKPSIGRSYLDENGKRWYATTREHGFNYCLNCGAKVVSHENLEGGSND